MSNGPGIRLRARFSTPDGAFSLARLRALVYSGPMSSEKNDDLKSFQIGLRSGASTSKKNLDTDHFEISKESFPSLAASLKGKATFKKKATEHLDAIKQVLKAGSDEEKAIAEKAKKAWERAVEVIAQASVKD